MRRAFAWWLSVTALGLSTSAALGQYPYPYPYPYAPMPMPYPPQSYGYPAPMPVYVPMPQQMYYPQPAMYNSMPSQGVMVYGPLTNAAPTNPQPMSSQPGKPSASAANPRTPAPQPRPSLFSSVSSIKPAGAEVRTMPVVSKNELPASACGDDCLPGCGPSCAPPRWDLPIRGKGHFIGEVAAYFLVPFHDTRPAYVTFPTGNPANGTLAEFPHSVVVGPHATVGYISHVGWGLRGGYTYINSVVGQSAVNTAGSGMVITTPFTGPFAINSPGPALLGGLGQDVFEFKQRLQLHIADLEIVKEASWLDTTFLVSFGGRYLNLRQSYTAVRNNPGGLVPFERQEFDSSSYVQAWGPTISGELVHPIVAGFSVYGNVRGSFLWGTDRFSQNLGSVSNLGGVFNATALTSGAYSHRNFTMVEPEAGLQFGCRVGRAYVFARAGAVYQHWWQVGSPTSATGNLSFVGGVAKLGIAY